MFRRRRRQEAGEAGPEYPDAAAGGADEADGREAPASAGGPRELELAGGPWDASESYPARDPERADFGSLLVPVVPTGQLELATDGQRFIWVTVKSGRSELRVNAFAAPKSQDLWNEVRQEIATELGSAGTAAEEIPGPFGIEVFARVLAEPGNPAGETTPVRFIGVDGPRWLLRGLIIGPAAAGEEPAWPLEQTLSDIVVVRGDHPMPPRDMLELRIPAEVQQALEQQAAAAQAAGQGGEGQHAAPGEESRFRTDLSPFEPGPEFTETR